MCSGGKPIKSFAISWQIYLIKSCKNVNAIDTLEIGQLQQYVVVHRF